ENMLHRKLAVRAAIAAMALAAGTVPPALSAAASVPGESLQTRGPQVTTVRYGPFTIPAASGHDHGETRNRLSFNVQKPCDDCFITGFKPNLDTASKSAKASGGTCSTT
ncbi:hypothetical protein, partial [Streptomyces bicolor]|uniref:hypothetical protein n=1 Tax=Streptomyces bicolor TaxID=66874 RepID=UPI001F16574E